MFGAALSPLSQAVILDRYPAEKRGAIMSVWGMVVMVGPILGPTLGGYLTDNYSWRWVFYVNVPVGVLAVAGLMIFLSDDERIEPQRFDWTGFGFFAVAVGALQFFLDRGTTKGWFSSSEIVLEAVLAGMGTLSVHRPLPHIEPHLHPSRPFEGPQLRLRPGTDILHRPAASGDDGAVAPYLQNLGGYSVLDTGLLLAPRGVGTMMAMIIMGRYVMKFDVRLPMSIGCILITWSMWEMSGWTPDISPLALAGTTFFQGIGMGFVFIPLNIMAFATLPARLRTDASAMINLVRNVGSAIGISITSTALAFAAQTAHANLTAHINPFNRALDVNAPSMMLNPHLPFGQAQLLGLIDRNALIVAYSDVFYLMLLLSLPAFLVLMLIPRPAQTLPSKPKVEILE